LLKTSIINFLKDAAMPPVCAVCGQISADSLCRECMAEIKPISSLESCSRCGKPLSAPRKGYAACAGGKSIILPPTGLMRYMQAI